MLQVKTHAFVLEKDPGYNDEGNLLLLTKKFGMVRAVASGICKKGSRLAAWTEPPSLITADLSLLEEKQLKGCRLLTLSPKSFFSHLHTDYQNLSWYFFYVRVLKHFMPYGIALPKFYPIWKEALHHQKSWENGCQRNVALAYFLTKLLKHEGVFPSWKTCVLCEHEWVKRETAYFHPSEQGLICENCSLDLVKNMGYSNNFYPSNNFFDILSLEKELVLPRNLLRVPQEERNILEICEDSSSLDKIFESIFSRSMIDDPVLFRVRNFLLIFLNSLL